MPTKLEWNREQLWSGCILAGIAHAIMVGEYPMMSNEHSWDGLNYSVQDSSGQRGTVSFRGGNCVAAFRNENSVRMNTFIESNLYFAGADEDIIRLANEEALQYLLDEVAGEVKPVITTAFWGKDILMTNDTLLEMITNGGDLLKNIVSNVPTAIQYWKDAYGMNNRQISLLKSLFERKIVDFEQSIRLSGEEVDCICFKSEEGKTESKESFFEMNIFWD